LGSGAGNDCFVARALTGENGRVVGIDMTEEMVEKAKTNVAKLGFSNVEFRLGDIENMPVNDNTADVVISNCVLNLVPDKKKAFTEIFRVLKPGGHLSVSDIVIKGELPLEVKEAAEMYAGCVLGAIQMDEYLEMMKNSGLKNVTIQKERQDILPDDLLLDYITSEQLASFKKSGFGIFSITVYAEK
jgi:arsenite methyltransferase